ncbi:Uncharacterised protein [Vibrio cholerae]|nr:Uncharacterised protein [Vibrio cholerae]
MVARCTPIFTPFKPSLVKAKSAPFLAINLFGI